jgi:hypothetical protein
MRRGCGRWGKAALAFGAAMTLAGCAGDEPRLLNLTRSPEQRGPDEFTVLPNRPLQAPESYATLPLPTPGANNRADLTPQADAVLALGGRPGAATPAGFSDPALAARVGRYGVQGGIRDQLAADDLAFRQRRDGLFLERLFSVNTYFRAYRQEELDQYRTLEAARAAGLPTPGAPPEPTR